MNDEIPERSVHRLLRQGLREEAGAHGANCLDAETVAAWMDGALAADVLAAAESHAAGCAHCQAVLSAMARTAPPIAPRSWWPSSLTLKWLVPAAAAATAAALWIAVVPPGTRPDATAPSRDEMNRVAPSPAPSLTPPPSSAATPAREGPLAPATPPAQERAASAPDLDKRKERKELDAVAKSEVEAPKMLEARRDNSETAKPIDKLTDQAAKQEEFRSRAAVAAPSVDAPASLPPAPPASAQIGAVQGFRTGVRLLRVIVSPDPASRWRAAAPGEIDHSADSGVTWTAQQTGTKAELIAGSSPARDVCWVVGRGGVVLLSTDGLAWQLRPFPEAIDLAAVSATDAKTATITTADGRRFSTTDGGATWFSPLLQESPVAPF